MGRGERVKVDGGALRAVDATQIDREAPVDEHEHVVVAGEPERLAALVDELGVQLVGERVVVAPTLVPEPLVVHREERPVRVPVHRRVRTRHPSQLDRHRDRHVDPRCVPVPHIEVLPTRSRDRTRRRLVGVHRLGIRAQIRLDDSPVIRDRRRLKIPRDTFAEITGGALQHNRDRLCLGCCLPRWRQRQHRRHQRHDDQGHQARSSRHARLSTRVASRPHLRSPPQVSPKLQHHVIAEDHLEPDHGLTTVWVRLHGEPRIQAVLEQSRLEAHPAERRSRSSRSPAGSSPAVSRRSTSDRNPGSLARASATAAEGSAPALTPRSMRWRVISHRRALSAA